ncbi:MAG TPA: hypothetical protein VIY48_10555 [Candidatus Paceibacterota bacterium]
MNVLPCRLRVLIANGDRVALFTQSLRDPKIDLALLGKVTYDTAIYDRFGPGFLFEADGSRSRWFISWINIHSAATNWAVLRWDGDTLLVSPITISLDYHEPLSSIGQVCGLPDKIDGIFRLGVR